MPLDEPPNLVSMLIALETAAVAELYRVLAGAGFDGLTPASAPIFQFVRPGGSDLEEIARLAGVSAASVAEQVAELERVGYVRAAAGGTVELTGRGRAAADLGLKALEGIEARWRDVLGAEAYGAFAGAVATLNLDPLGRRIG